MVCIKIQNTTPSTHSLHHVQRFAVLYAVSYCTRYDIILVCCTHAPEPTSTDWPVSTVCPPQVRRCTWSLRHPRSRLRCYFCVAVLRMDRKRAFNQLHLSSNGRPEQICLSTEGLQRAHVSIYQVGNSRHQARRRKYRRATSTM